MAETVPRDRRRSFPWMRATFALALAAVGPWLLVCLVTLALVDCTHNPFSEERVGLEAREIRGRVSLDRGTSPEGVYVWLEKLAAATWTDAGGEFRLPLSTGATHAGTGFTGSLRLFFYVGNYGLKTAEVVLRNGELVSGHGDVGEAGELRSPVLLGRLLEVMTQVQPDTFPPPVGGDVGSGTFAGASIAVTVTLRADVDTLPVLLPNRRGGPAAVLMVRSLDPHSPLQMIPQESLPVLTQPLVADTVTPAGRTWDGRFYLPVGVLPRGRYEVVPYVLVPQEQLPQALLGSLGVGDRPGLEYLRLPFKRRGGVLTVMR